MSDKSVGWDIVRPAVRTVYAHQHGIDPSQVRFDIDEDKEDPLSFIKQNEEKFEKAAEWAAERGDDSRARLIEGLLAVARGDDLPEQLELDEWR